MPRKRKYKKPHYSGIAMESEDRAKIKKMEKDGHFKSLNDFITQSILFFYNKFYGGNNE